MKRIFFAFFITHNSYSEYIDIFELQQKTPQKYTPICNNEISKISFKYTDRTSSNSYGAFQSATFVLDCDKKTFSDSQNWTNRAGVSWAGSTIHYKIEDFCNPYKKVTKGTYCPDIAATIFYGSFRCNNYYKQNIDTNTLLEILTRTFNSFSIKRINGQLILQCKGKDPDYINKNTKDTCEVQVEKRSL